MAKASFSAYFLGKNVLETGEKVYFLTKKKSTTKFGLFCSFPFSLFASKWLQFAAFAFQKGKKVGRKRGLRHIYIYIYMRHICRTPQLVGSFEALRFIEAEEKKEK